MWLKIPRQGHEADLPRGPRGKYRAVIGLFATAVLPSSPPSVGQRSESARQIQKKKRIAEFTKFAEDSFPGFLSSALRAPRFTEGGGP